MIIETKGTKTEGPERDDAQGLAKKGPGARSRTPYYLALAVSAVAAYLKSLFHDPVRAEAETATEWTAPPWPAPARPTLATGGDSEGAEPSPEQRPKGSGAPAPDAEPTAAEYEAREAVRVHALHFATPEQKPDLGDFKASPVIPSPLNDNRGNQPAGGGGGGGHSGGGHGPPGAGDRATPRSGNGEGSADGEGLPGPFEGHGEHPTRDGMPGETPTGGDKAVGEGGTLGDGQSRPGRPPGEGRDGGGAGVQGDAAGGRRNRAPVASGPVHLADAARAASLAIAPLDLLRNSSDPDGDALTVRGVSASSGGVARDGDGWLFESDMVGPVTLTYEVTDGDLVVTQTATLNVVDHAHDPHPGSEPTDAAPRTGTGGDMLILGTPFADRISGGDGNDDIDARAGADLVDGGPGDDHIVGGDGDDTILGGTGMDVILAGAGRDVVSGGAGNDRIFGEDGDDILSGDEGDDFVDGGSGSDIIVGGAGDDTLVGGEGDDRIDGGGGNDVALAGSGGDVVYGGAGDDRLEGGAGDDILSDGAGSDVVLGQEGDDVVVAALDGEADLFDGGSGTDTLDLSATTSGVVVDLTAGTVEGPEIGRDRVASIEVVRGGSGSDTMTGDAGPNALFGGAGADRLAGGAGDDLLDGGADGDTLADGAGSDTVLGGEGDDVLVAAADGEADRFEGGDGVDTLDLTASTRDVVVDLAAGTAAGQDIGSDAVASVEVVLSGGGNDRIAGGAANESLSGGAGGDNLSGGGGDDRLDGGAGDDLLSDGSGSDTVSGGDGDDTLTVASDGEADAFDGGSGTDTLDLSGTSKGVVVDLGTGTSVGAESGRDAVKAIEAVLGGSGADDISGSAGSDKLRGGDGDDRLVGRAGDDVLEGGSGHDTIHDGAGRDVVRGGAGDDVVVLSMDGDDDEVDGGDGSDTLDLGGATGDLIVDLVSHVVSGTDTGHDKVESVERIIAGLGDDRFVIGDEDVVLTGGGGDDRYEFSSHGKGGEPTHSTQITDFSVGDHIDLLKWTFFEETPGAKGESLAEAMDRKDGTVSGIRYKSAHLDGGDTTVITADLDHDDVFETTIVLDGQHSLLFVAAATTPAPSPTNHVA